MLGIKSRESNQTLLIRFVTCHNKVKLGLQDAAQGLREIRDDKLYIMKGYDSFKAYCDDTFGSYLKGYRLIEAGKITKEIPQVTTQAAALAVSKIPPRQQKQVVGNVIASGEKVTPKAIELEAKKLVKIKDNSGMDVPTELVPFWNRNEEIQSLLGHLRRIRGIFEGALENKEENKPSDPLYRKMDVQSCVSKLKAIEAELKGTKSDYVCPECNGVLTQDCQLCSGRGTISEFFWKMIPEEKKLLRNKQ